MHFAVELAQASGWNPELPIREQEGWDAHAAFMDSLVDDGFLVLGGPVGDWQTTLHLVEAADEHAVRARFATDPWAESDLLRVGSIRPWALWLDSRESSHDGTPPG